MTGETRLTRWALLAGALGVPAAAGLAYLLRGAEGAASAAIAAVLPPANLALAAALQGFVAKRWPQQAVYVTMPSFAVRLIVMMSVFAVLEAQPFIDGHAFAVAFAASMMAVLAAECAAYARTPFLALEMRERV